MQRADGSPYYDPQTRENLHGAWVVIDVPTGEVRSLGSFPTYDLNDFTAQYAALNNDVINRPLINRATMDQVEPGSSVKVVIGSTALTKGYIGLARRDRMHRLPDAAQSADRQTPGLPNPGTLLDAKAVRPCRRVRR